LVFPIGVATPMFLKPSVAVLAMLRVAVTVVEFTTVKVPAATLTPAPPVRPPLSPFSPVAPVRLLPVMVTGTLTVPLAGCVPEVGLIETSVAPWTVNGTVLLVPPPGTVMLTVLADSVAPVLIVKVAVAVVGLVTVKPLTVTPVPDTVTAVAPVRLVPVKVTGTLVPRTPVAGAIEVSVGTGRPITVNVTVLLVPPGALTVTFRAEAVALPEIAKVAVTVLSFTTVRPLTATPPPGTLMAVVPVRPLPTRVTATLAARLPEAGVIEVSAGPFTVNGTVPLVPPGVVTLMVRAPSAALEKMLMVAVIVVEFTTVTPVTVIPLVGAATFTVVPAAVKFMPLKVTGTLVPRKPEAGVIELSMGVPGTTTVNVTGVVVPAGEVTVTFLAVSAAVGEMVKVAVTVVSLTTAMPLTVMPPPDTLTAVAPVRLMPVRVTDSLVPRAPVFGATEYRPAGGTRTVNVTALLDPAGVVTVTFLAPPGAPAEITNVAVTVVSLSAFIPVTVTPPPETAIAEVPVRPVPVRVTKTELPRRAEAGAIDVSTGPVTVNVALLLDPPGVTT
jgi:hypothetical protein